MRQEYFTIYLTDKIIEKFDIGYDKDRLSDYADVYEGYKKALEEEGLYNENLARFSKVNLKAKHGYRLMA